MRPLTICASSNQHSLDPHVRTNFGCTVLTTLHNPFALGQKFGGSSSWMVRQVIVAGEKCGICVVGHTCRALDGRAVAKQENGRPVKGASGSTQQGLFPKRKTSISGRERKCHFTFEISYSDILTRSGPSCACMFSRALRVRRETNESANVLVTFLILCCKSAQQQHCNNDPQQSPRKHASLRVITHDKT